MFSMFICIDYISYIFVYFLSNAMLSQTNIFITLLLFTGRSFYKLGENSITLLATVHSALNRIVKIDTFNG